MTERDQHYSVMAHNGNHERVRAIDSIILRETSNYTLKFTEKLCLAFLAISCTIYRIGLDLAHAPKTFSKWYRITYI